MYFGLQESLFVQVWLKVSNIYIFNALVNVPQAPHHSLLCENRNESSDGQGQNVKEEVDEVLVCFSKSTLWLSVFIRSLKLTMVSSMDFVRRLSDK